MRARPIEELVDTENDSWMEFRETLENGKNSYTILSIEQSAAEDTIYRLQVSTKSYLGSIAYRTGGIIFDHGWITLLGAGGAGVYGSLTSWNGLQENAEIQPLEGMLVVAYDAAGGFFAMDTGRFGRTGHVYYFAPDTLEWESTELAYSGFTAWLADGDLGLFYQTFRWEAWQEKIRQLGAGQVFAYYPPLWSEEGSGESSSKTPISIKEAWLTVVDVSVSLTTRFSYIEAIKGGSSSMTEKIPCNSEGCAATILPTTAAKTGGYCMPCHQEQERRKRQAYIERHRKTVNLYEGLNDKVEILKIMHAPRRYDPLVEYIPYPLNKVQMYDSLSSEEAASLMDYAMHLFASGDEETSQEILSSLVCYRNDSVAGCLPILMENGVYYPGILYKDATPDIRDRLLEQVEWDDDNRNHILLMLAWIGDEQVVRRFHKWRVNPPQWAGQMYVAPETYAHEAGWKLSDSGDRMDLVHEQSYAIESIGGNPVPVAHETSAKFLRTGTSDCPWCGGKLTTLIEVDTTHPVLAKLNLPLDRLRVDTCVLCGCYNVIYMELGADGVPRWSEYNRKPEHMSDVEECSEEYLQAGPELRLSTKPRSAFYAAIWELSQQCSQLGGHPSWVQDAELPDCPCCGQSMFFIGQLDWSDLEQYGEGIYYMFVCPKDRMTATTYQQS
jgi:hypothetical protein|nr:DUF2625 family protein [Paenibacillus sp.]